MGGRRSPRYFAPKSLVELPPYVRQRLGAESDRLLEALALSPPTSIRLNPLKPFAAQGSPVPWCEHGRYLDLRPIFTLDPLLHAGAYYVQEASSMLLAQAFQSCAELPPDAVVLDLCAAPGGKSTHLAALLSEEALLICNEPVRARQPALTENLWKWGRPNVVITGAAPEAFRPMGTFCDLVLVDAPCSGEGMFRKDPYARTQWSPQLVETCATRQEGILDAAWEALRPGGYLIYSTCTWEACENEDQVSRLQERGAEVVDIPVDPAWGVEVTDRGLRCYPHRLQGEGFFVAVMRKPNSSREINSPQPRTTEASDPNMPWHQWLKDPGTVATQEVKEVQYGIDQRWSGLVNALTNTLHVMAPGIPVAQHKGEGWVPHAALALNAMLDHNAFHVVDLDRTEVLRYLRGEAMPGTDASGTALVRYQGLGMGWVNGAGKRWNNKWPAPWRIRMR